MIGDAAPGPDEELVLSFGARHVVPRGPGMAAAVRALYPSGVDAVLDAALLGPAILPAVRDGGQLLAVRPFQGETERGIAISLVLVGQHLHEGDRLASLAELASNGVLTLRIAELLPAERAAEAHQRLAAGGVRGRLVLTFAPRPRSRRMRAASPMGAFPSPGRTPRPPSACGRAPARNRP